MRDRFGAGEGIAISGAAIAPLLAPSYVGPGDLVSFTAWWGMRAYSAATCGTACIRVVRASDSAQSDINSLANGSLDAATLATFLTATTGKIVTWYDQVGTNDLTQSNDAERPAVLANALGSSYGTNFASAQARLVSTGVTASQPYSFVVICRDPALATYGLFAIDNEAYAGWVVDIFATGTIRSYAGANFDTASGITANTWTAMQFIANGASSVYARNGSESTGNAGAQALTNYPISLGYTVDGSFTGQAVEAGYIAGTISSGNRTALNTNMRAAYGGF